MKRVHEIILLVLISGSFNYGCKKIHDEDCPVCPQIDHISPVSGRYGDTITITGINFATSGNKVKINGDDATKIFESNTVIKVTVPLRCGSGDVTVDVDADKTSFKNAYFKYINTYTVSLYAGVPEDDGWVDGTATTSKFKNPFGIAMDLEGNMYVSDWGNDRIRIISNGMVGTYAGDGGAGYVDNNNPLLAEFNRPRGIVVNSSKEVFIADCENHCIRKITANGNVTTFCGKGEVAGFVNGISTVARFDRPAGLALLHDTLLFISEWNNHTVRKSTLFGFVSPVAGTGIYGSTDGSADIAQFWDPQNIAILDDNSLIVADNGNNKIRKINFNQGVVSTAAGNGQRGNTNGDIYHSSFNDPYGVEVRNFKGKKEIYVADFTNNVIRMIEEDGQVSTVIGTYTPGYSEGDGSEVKLKNPSDVLMDPLDNNTMYISDRYNHCIRKVVIE